MTYKTFILIGLVSVPLRAAESTPPMPELWELVLQVVLTDTEAEAVDTDIDLRSIPIQPEVQMSPWSVV